MKEKQLINHNWVILDNEDVVNELRNQEYDILTKNKAIYENVFYYNANFYKFGIVLKEYKEKKEKVYVPMIKLLDIIDTEPTEIRKCQRPSYPINFKFCQRHLILAFEQEYQEQDGEGSWRYICPECKETTFKALIHHYKYATDKLVVKKKKQNSFANKLKDIIRIKNFEKANK